MNDQRSGGAQFRGDLVLVRPAAVVGHGRPAEDVVKGRIVDQEQENLAAEVRIAEIVPVVFGGASAVAHEDELGAVDGYGIDHVPGCSHVVRGRLQGEGLGAAGNHEILRRQRGDPHQRHILHPGPVRIAGRRPRRTELLDEIVHGQFLTHRPGRAAFEFIRCQYPDFGKQRLGADSCRDLRGGLWRHLHRFHRLVRDAHGRAARLLLADATA